MLPTTPLFFITNHISYVPEPSFPYFYLLSLNQFNSHHQFFNGSFQKNIFLDYFQSSTQQNYENEDLLSIQSPLTTIQTKIPINQIEKMDLTVGFKIKTDQNKKRERQDESYIPKISNQRYQTANERYTRKNIQANVVNQLFSYLWSKEKSYRTLIKIKGVETEKCQIFYEIMAFLKKKCSKQLNRNFLKQLCNYKQGCLGYIITTKKFKEKLNILNLEQFSKIVRCAFSYFLNQVGFTSILTSKRMRSQIWSRHLIKCRELCQYLFQRENQSTLILSRINQSQN